MLRSVCSLVSDAAYEGHSIVYDNQLRLFLLIWIKCPYLSEIEISITIDKDLVRIAPISNIRVVSATSTIL